MIGAAVTIAFLIGLTFFPGFGHRRTSVTDVDCKPTFFFGVRKIYDPAVKPKKNEARVLMVHGMGAEKDHSYEKLSNAIAEKLGFGKPEKEEPVELPPPMPLPLHAQPARLTVRTYHAGRQTLRTYDVLWAPLIYDIKYKDLADDEAKLMTERAWANGFLKQSMMNTRLTDPVLYLGTMQPFIRSAVKQSVCRMLNGTWIPPQGGHGEDCLNPTSEGTGIAVITESLGSYVALEAIDDLENDHSGATFTMPIRGFYMLANQLPLLHLAHPDDDPMARFLLKVATPARHDFKFDNIHSDMEVVTISDPDDILSYPISPSLAKHYGNAHFVNVRTPIGRRYLAGALTNPVRAHTGGAENSLVMHMLTDGGGNFDEAKKAAMAHIAPRCEH
jgi:hypothetical protein